MSTLNLNGDEKEIFINWYYSDVQDGCCQETTDGKSVVFIMQDYKEPSRFHWKPNCRLKVTWLFNICFWTYLSWPMRHLL